MESAHVAVLIDTCLPVNAAAHKRQLDNLFSVLGEFVKDGKSVLFHNVFVGSLPPHHTFSVRAGLSSTSLSEIQKEIAKTTFEGGGFGSCLLDGIAKCFAYLNTSTAPRKYLCIVPSAYPQFQSVKLVKPLVGETDTALASHFINLGVFVSLFLPLSSSSLETFFKNCGGVISQPLSQQGLLQLYCLLIS